MKTESDRDVVARHPELHHYTGQSGLEGIIRNNVLWATLYSDLNDITETNRLGPFLEKALALRFLPIIRQKQSESLRVRRAREKTGKSLEATATEAAHSMVASFYQTTFSGGERMVPYVASFCTHAGDQPYERENGLLSQWRAYAREGGFCIVFDTSKTVDLLDREFPAHYYVHLQLGQVNYDSDDFDFDTVFGDLLTFSEQALIALIEGNDISYELLNSFLAAAPLLKHRGFAEERELRIVAIPGSQRLLTSVNSEHPSFQPPPLKRVHTRDRRGLPGAHYIELFDSLSAKLPIRRVIVGPARRQAENQEFARALVGNSVDVISSQTPLIE